MIESDINEQMANFSPTQNVNPGIDRDVDPVAADIASNRTLLPDPMLPKENAVPDIDPDAAAIAARRNNELMASMMAASQTNPAEAAKALKLGEKFGIGTDMALRNQADLERIDLMNSVQRRDLMQRDPILARYLTQRDFAAIAHDDIDNLSATESIFNYIKRIPSRIETGLIQAVDTAERGEIYTRQRAGEFRESDKIVLNAIKTELANLPQDTGFIESAAQFMGIRAEMAPTMFRRAALGTVVGAAMGGPAGAAVGMGVGLDVGSFEVGAEMEGGNAYGDMKEAGYNDAVAVPASVGVGVINGALELVGGKILTAGYRYAFKSAVNTATREALVRPTTVAALKTLGVHYAKDIAGETATEVAQEIVTIAGDEIARHYGSNLESRLASPEGRREIADRLVETAVQTAMGMAVIGAGGPAAQFYVDQSQANAANKSQQFFERLNNNVVNSEVRSRNADAYERFVASQAEGTGAETIYVDAREMATVLRQSEITDQEMDRVLPGLRQQLEQAMSTGGDVKIPTAGFAARVAGTDLGNAMMPHMRLDPTAMSARQAEQYVTQLEQRKAEALAIMEESEKTNITFVDEARVIEMNTRAQLEAAGRDKKQAKFEATIYRDMVVVAAAREKMTPAEYQAKHGLRGIVGPETQQAIGPLEQADQFDQAGQRRTDTPQFRDYFGESKVVDEQGQPLVVYHGTNKLFDIFKVDPLAWFGDAFLASQFVAGGRMKYTDKARKGSMMYPVYLSIQRPLMLRRGDRGLSMHPMDMVSLAEVLKIAGLPNDEAALRAIAQRQLDTKEAGVSKEIADPAGYLAAKYLEDARLYNILDNKSLIETFKNAGYDGIGISEDGSDTWAVFSPEQVKSVNNRGTWDKTSPRMMEQAATLDADYLAAVERGDMDAAQRMVDETAERQMPSSQVRDASGKLLRIYHGSQRIDRVGNRLLKKRTTSGPMPFFTDTRAIAEGYAKGKQDTSIENIGYEQWIKYKPRGQQGMVNLDQAWFYLTPEERATATERLYTVGYENPDEGTGEIVGNTETIASRDHVQFLIRQARGNALTAAKELWLNSGSLFNDEQKFMDVLKGMKLGERFVYDSPHAVNSGIIEAYANITNPLDTSAIPTSVVDALQKRANRVRKPADQYGQDAWDKRTRDPQSWMETLRSDIAEGRTQAWTSIPDWATDVLTKLGYDGIKDSGGKYGGDPHVVWIPFNPQQIKFANPITKDGSGKIIPLSERFDLTSPMMFRQEAAPFEQAAPGPARGGYDPSRLTILLNSKADASTFWHELGHWQLDVMSRMATDGTASAETLADLDTMYQWFGIAGTTPQERLATWNSMSMEQQRPHHEALAYNFETYVVEGKAPSIEMQGVFERLAAFIKRVYVSIRDDLNAIYRREFGKDLPILTGEVRQVMDRWLASEEQIQRKQAMMQMVPLFLSPEEAAAQGMDAAAYAAYQQMNKEAEEAAVTDLTKASLRQMQWLSGARSRVLKELQAKHDELRKKTRAEVMEEVQNEPVYAAMSILKTGKGRAKNGELVEFNDKFKLNLEAVKTMVPAEQVRQLGYGKYGMVAEDGIAPDMVAEMVGFESGDELILALLAAKPLKEEVDARTDKRMMEEHGELNTPQAMEEAVQRALHNEARARFNAVEVRWLSKSTSPVQVFMDAAKLAAKQIIAGKVIRDLRPSDYQAAEAKAAREAADAHKSRRTAEQAAQAAATKERNLGLSAAAAGVPMIEVETAAATKAQEAAQRVSEREAEYKAKYGDRTPDQVILRAKQIQLLQNQLAREAQEAKDEIAKAAKDFRKFFKADDKLAKTRNMDLVEAARAILSAFGFGKSDKSPAEYIDKLKAYNPEMYLAIEPLVLAATAGSKNYKDLTVEQFRQLKEVVDALWEQSRRDKLIEIEGKMVALSDVVGELETRLDEIGVPEVVIGDRGAATFIERRILEFYDFKAAVRRVENWASATDGAKANGVGPFTKYIWRPIKDAINAYRVDRNKYVLKYLQLLKQIVLPVGKIDSKELDYTFGNGKGGVGRAELLGALMHTGNDSNKRKLLLGRGWATLNEDGTLDTSRWDAFVDRMIEQGVLTKADFDFVQATWDLLEEVKPIAQRAHRSMFGFYFKEVQATSFTNKFGTFRGGYVPAKTDAMIVRDAQRNSKMEELESDFRNSMPSTGMGFTKGRVEYNKPLSMDVRLVVKHIDDVLRFAHVQPAIKDTLRIVKNRGFADKLNRIDPTAIDDMIIPWLNRAARQITSEPGRNKRIDKFWKTVRSRTGMSIMTANLRNAMQQVTGLFPSALKVSKTQLGNALLTYMGSPFKTAQEVASLSSFMDERLQSQIFDMQDDINEILLNPSAYSKVNKWTQRHAYFLQSAFQNMVDVVTWTAKYNQVLAESKVGASDAKVQREAIQQADAAVRLTQGSMSAEDISASSVGSAFYKTFNQFGDYFNMLANLNADEYIKVVRDLGWRGNKGKLLNIYILGFMAPALVADAIARSMGGGWDDDDDGYLDDVMDWFFGSQARAAVAMIPFGSTAATALTAAFNSKAYDDRITASPSIAALEASTIGVGKTIINIAEDDKEVTGKNVRDVMTLISLATGTPVTVLGRPVGYLVDVNRKKIKPTGPIDVARGLVTGVPSAESKKK